MIFTVGHGTIVSQNWFQIITRNDLFSFVDVICNYRGYGNNSGFLCDKSHCILRREVCDGRHTCSSGVDESEFACGKLKMTVK